MFKSINHIQVTMPFGEEEKAKAFYGGMLGLVELEKPEALKANGGVWFQVGALQVHLGCEDNDRRHHSKAHIAYNVDNIEECRAKFNALGIKVYENTQIEGYKRFDIRDPFGNRIELIEKIS